MKNIEQEKGEMLPRYGKYKPKTYLAWGWFFVVVLLFSVINKEIDLGALFFAILLAVLQIFITHREMYRIQNRSIVTKKFSSKTIPLPADLILIIAKGSTLSFPYRRLRSMDHLIELNDCYMICIIENCTLHEAMNIMRWNRYSKEYRYSNVFVREVFFDNVYSNFLYSFAYESSQLQKLVANHNCQIILPKSLEGKVDLSGINVPIHIDEEG